MRSRIDCGPGDLDDWGFRGLRVNWRAFDAADTRGWGRSFKDCAGQDCKHLKSKYPHPLKGGG